MGCVDGGMYLIVDGRGAYIWGMVWALWTLLEQEG